MSALLLRFPTSAPGNGPPSPPPPVGGFKYASGFGGVTPQYGTLASASPGNNFVYIKQFVTHPAPFFYWQIQWQDCDQGSTLDNSVAHAVAGTGNFAGMQTNVGNIVNLIVAYLGGNQKFGLFSNTANLWQGLAPTGPMGSSPIPNYIMNCNGSLTVPTTFGASTTTTYSLYKYPGLGQCGFNFYAYNSPGAGDYGFMLAAYQDPAVVNARNNFHQALLGNFQLGASTPYNAGTNYTALGQMVSSGSLFYVNINTTLVDSSGNLENLGNPLTNTAVWKQTPNPYAGKTLNQCPNYMATICSDETSANFNQGPLVPGQTSSANACTWQNYIAGYQAAVMGMGTAAPNTPFAGSNSYVITGSDGGEMPGNTWNTLMAQMNAVPGWMFSQADISGNMFSTSPYINKGPTNAMLAYRGLNGNGGYPQGVYPAFGSYSTDYLLSMGGLIQGEPEDFGTRYTAQQVLDLLATTRLLGGVIIVSVQDDNFNQTAWTSYIQPTLAAAAPLSTTVPTNLL